MKLIKKLPGEKIGKFWRYYGLFLCEYCNKEFKRERIHGLKQKSCGCVKNKLTSKANTKHGDSRRIRLYKIWIGMKSRCYNKKYPKYKDYGGRDIKICDQWKDNYVMFKIWALCHGYKNNLIIDRINNNKEYSPKNCRWVTYLISNRNKRSNKLTLKKANQIRSLYFNIKIKQKLLGKIFNIDKSYISYIVNNKKYIDNTGDNFG